MILPTLERSLHFDYILSTNNYIKYKNTLSDFYSEYSYFTFREGAEHMLPRSSEGRETIYTRVEGGNILLTDCLISGG